MKKQRMSADERKAYKIGRDTAREMGKFLPGCHCEAMEHLVASATKGKPLGYSARLYRAYNSGMIREMGLIAFEAIGEEAAV